MDRQQRFLIALTSSSPATILAPHRGTPIPRETPQAIDVVRDPNVVSLPPHVSVDQLTGFGIAMGKLVLSGHIDEVVDTIEANVRNL
jgi:hypothetical protein